MRLTCLTCGHQFDVQGKAADKGIQCVCGAQHVCPEVVDTGTCPNEKAAERSRAKAFRAAGLSKNVGGFALWLSLIGIVLFPIGLVGALLGLYVLVGLKGSIRRYSGPITAMIATGVGLIIFFGEGLLVLHWIEARSQERIATAQAGVADDLKTLLRAQRLYRVSNETYGTFQDFRFKPIYGKYTYYLRPDSLVEAKRDGETIADPIPQGLLADVDKDAFTALAVANLDRDEFLDVWQLTHGGSIVHLADDATDTTLEGKAPASKSHAHSKETIPKPPDNKGPNAPSETTKDKSLVPAKKTPHVEPEVPVAQPEKPVSPKQPDMTETESAPTPSSYKEAEIVPPSNQPQEIPRPAPVPEDAPQDATPFSDEENPPDASTVPQETATTPDKEPVDTPEETPDADNLRFSEQGTL